MKIQRQTEHYVCICYWLYCVNTIYYQAVKGKLLITAWIIRSFIINTDVNSLIYKVLYTSIDTRVNVPDSSNNSDKQRGNSLLFTICNSFNHATFPSSSLFKKVKNSSKIQLLFLIMSTQLLIKILTTALLLACYLIRNYKGGHWTTLMLMNPKYSILWKFYKLYKCKFPSVPEQLLY